MTVTKAEIHAIVGVIRALNAAIEEAGPKGIPSGHLYAAVMGVMSYDTYTKAIGVLVGSGLVTNEYHVLRAVPQ